MGRPRTMPRLEAGMHFYEGRWWKHFPSGQRQPAVEKQCEICGTVAPVLERELARGRGQTCSRLCNGKWQAIHRVGIRKRGYSSPGDVKLGPSREGYLVERVSDADMCIDMSLSKSRGGTHDGWVLQHRLVMARSLGRPLTRREQVHHRNGVKDDNRIENLQLRSGPHGNGLSARCADCGSHNIVFGDV